MFKIQTAWQLDRLLIWATTAEGAVRVEGTEGTEGTEGAALVAPLTPEALRDQLGEICSDALVIVSATDQTLDISGQTVPALALPPAQAVDFLLSLPDDSPALAESTRLWHLLTQFVSARIAAGQFRPTIIMQQGATTGAWRILVSGNDELHWLQAVADTLATLGLPGEHRPDQLVESFMECAADLLIRRTFAEDPFFARTAEKCRIPEATADQRFIASLLTTDSRIDGLDPQTIDQVRVWSDALHEGPITASFRLVFQLTEPPEGDDVAWSVQFLLEPLRGEGELVPAARLWELGENLPAILGRNLARQRQSLLEQLQLAAQAWPVLQERIPPAPSSIPINPAEAIALIRQWSGRLIDAGFGVKLPKWATSPARELSIQLSVSPVENPALFFPPGPGTDGGSSSADAFAVGSRQIGLDSLLQFDWRVAVGSMQLSDAEFQSILGAQSPLVRYNGEWIQVDADAAQRAMEFIQANRTGQMTLADALRTAYGSSVAETGLEISGLTGVDWIGQLLQQAPDASLQTLPQPADFAGQLRPYQLRGLQWLAFLQKLGIGACLADDMGLGKTIQLIALMLLERQHAREKGLSNPGPTLLFAPTSVIGNWAREVERFAPALRVLVHHGVLRQHGKEFAATARAMDLVITTYALAVRDIEDFRAVAWHRLTLDEAQKIKNPSAASTSCVRSIAASYRIALTGTPIENHLSELWSIMEILNPGLLGSAGNFRESFAVPVERLGDHKRAQHLRDLIKPFVLRRTKSDPLIAGELPAKLEMKVFCNLTVEQAQLYQRITDEMLGQIDAASGIRRRGLILAALTRLKQVCDHPALVEGKIAGLPEKHGAIDGRSGKCERLIEMLEEVRDEGDSALIFTQYKEMGDLLENVLPRRLNCPVLYLHGGTPAARRDAMIKQFQDPHGGVRIFILSLRAGGLGLNLTAANHVFHFDRWWNPAVEQQATDRAHRIGQIRQVQVHKYVCIGTMEERIDRMLTEKTQLADRIITSGDEWLTSLSTEELRRTLQLSADAVEDYSTGGA